MCHELIHAVFTFFVSNRQLLLNVTRWKIEIEKIEYVINIIVKLIHSVFLMFEHKVARILEDKTKTSK